MDQTVSDTDLLQVIKDFLNMGHVDNIAAMFTRDACPFDWTGAILDDERFNVRLGVSVLFEELKRRVPERLDAAIPSLLPLLASDYAYLRGDTISVLAIIGTPAAYGHIHRMSKDPDPLVQEIVSDILDELDNQNSPKVS